jgi:hypothetical protein
MSIVRNPAIKTTKETRLLGYKEPHKWIDLDELDSGLKNVRQRKRSFLKELSREDEPSEINSCQHFLSVLHP